MKRSILIPVLTLILCGALLFGVCVATYPAYLENYMDWHLKDMQTVLPGAETFTKESYSGEDANIRSVHKADIGYVVETVTYGYAGEITMLIGVNNAGRVTGLVVRDAHETFGLGGKVLTDHVFLAQFLNKTGSFEVATHGADAFSSATGSDTATEGESVEVDAISGATVTSKAVVRCINSAVSFVTGADVTTEATSWGG